MKKRTIIDAAIFIVLCVLSYFVMKALTYRPAVVNGNAIGGMAYAVILPLLITAPLTSWLLITSLKDFKASSRHAYYLISAGIFLFALSQVEQVIIALLIVFQPSAVEKLSPGLISLMFLLPFSFSLFALYFGARKLARILNVKTIWRSVWVTLIFSVLSASLYLVLPLTSPTLNSLAQVTLFFGAIILAATLVMRRVASTMNSGYRPAMYWMVAALAVMSPGLVQEIVFKGTVLVTSPYVQQSMDLIPFLISTFLFLQAGRAFKEATFKRLPTTATYVDAVVYTAELVSNRAEIDSILDDMRAVTAQGNHDLNEAEKKKLLGVYRRIESYLVEKEPMRQFTVASLRERLPNEFQEAVATS